MFDGLNIFLNVLFLFKIGLNIFKLFFYFFKIGNILDFVLKKEKKVIFWIGMIFVFKNFIIKSLYLILICV